MFPGKWLEAKEFSLPPFFPKGTRDVVLSVYSPFPCTFRRLVVVFTLFGFLN